MLRDPRSEFDAAADVDAMSSGEEVLSYERLLRRVASLRSRVIAAAVLADRRILNEPRDILDRMCERASGLQRMLESEAGESAETGPRDGSSSDSRRGLRHDARNAINVVGCYADVLLCSLNGEPDLARLLREVVDSLHLIEESLDAALAARHGPRTRDKAAMPGAEYPSSAPCERDQEHGVPWPVDFQPVNGNEMPGTRAVGAGDLAAEGSSPRNPPPNGAAPSFTFINES